LQPQEVATDALLEVSTAVMTLADTSFLLKLCFQSVYCDFIPYFFVVRAENSFTIKKKISV
jgi:hypothetical protein